ncbi:MAG: hypothetical protein QNI84_01155 [Henriciella sp.]|nr:hypothetical protein [Henriciella sp.]
MMGLQTLSRPGFGRLLALPALVAMGLALPAHTDTVDRITMSQEGIVIVWGADSTNATPIASDFILENNGTNVDLIAGDVFTVVTGTLQALDESFPDGAGATLRIRRIAGGGNQTANSNGDRFTSAADSFSAFGLRNNTDIRTVRSEIESSFYVASNKGFNIDATSSVVGDPADLDLIRLRARITETDTDDGLSFGTAAQYAHTGNSTTAGLRWTGYRRLSRMTSGMTMFVGNRRTAESPGSIADQSIRFDLDYRWNTGNIDLADGTFDVEAEVEYTVYIP